MQPAFDQPVPAASTSSASSSGEAGHESFSIILVGLGAGIPRDFVLQIADVALQCLCCQSVSPLQTYCCWFWCSA